METRGFNRFVRDYIRQSRGNVSVILRKLAFMLLRGIILKWPVDTGRSRMGWAVAAGFLGIPVPPAPKPDEAAKGFVPGEVGFNASGDSGRFWATNAVVYAPYLEEGWSAQAPMGAVRITMREIIAALGGGALPRWVQELYAYTWETLKVKPGSEIRGGMLAEATGLKRGGAV
jgi:hypothetical protein